MVKSLLNSLAAPLVAGAMLLVGFGLEASSPVGAQFSKDADPLRYLRKAQPTRLEQKKAEIFFGRGSDGVMKAQDKRPDNVLDPSFDFGYLESPSGETWYYTTDREIVKVPLEGGMAFETNITGFTFTVYDANFKKIGSVTDEVRLKDDELRVASVDIDMSVSRKFYNYDDKYEISVVLMFNKPDYTVSVRTQAYSLDGNKTADGNSEVIATIDGYPVEALNIQPDKWSENFFMTFMTDITPNEDEYTDYLEYFSNFYQKLTTYKKVPYGSTVPQAVHEFSIPRLNLPGDQMNAPMFMLSEHNGLPVFTYSYYEKSFFVDPTGFAQDESATPDNALILKVFELPSLFTTEVTEISTTRIPTEIKPSDRLLYTFYSVGRLSYRDDVSFGVYDKSTKPCFVVTTEDYTLENDEMYMNSYFVYNNDGEQILTIDTEVEGVVTMSDIKGMAPQAMFIHNNPDGYEFYMINLIDGEVEAVVDQTLGTDDPMKAITSNVDRISHLGKVYYVADMSYGEVGDDDSVFARVAWLNTDGTLNHIDRLNLGKDIAIAQCYLDSSALNPYIFDSDSEVEYLVLVKRYESAGSTATREELLVVGAETGVMLQILPDNDFGKLVTIALTNLETTPQLMVVYVNDDSEYVQTFYSLPFSQFEGGSGTAADPYLIGSVADLQLIKNNASACYKIVRDFDAAGYNFTPVSSFSGVLDGDGHTISNLTISSGQSYTGLFNQTVSNSSGDKGAVVKNLVFVNPEIELLNGANNAGLIAGSGSHLTVEGVKVFGLRAITDSDFNGVFGSLVGVGSLYSTISSCYVSGADINLEEASVGGIAGELRTSSSVKASAFSGDINGGVTVGGIVASTLSGDEVIADCHVDADITAKSVVGGVIGFSTRGPVTRCYVEGSVTATGTSGYYSFVSAGGVVGELETNYSSEEEASAPVSNNLVNLSSISGPEQTGKPLFDGQFNTVHRIVGKTAANEAPAVDDYDDDDNPIFGDRLFGDETGIVNNYAYDTLPVVDSTVEAAKNSSEGATIDAYDVDMEFIESLGFLYGETTAEPWNALSGNDPSLYFETGFALTPSEITAFEGETFNVVVSFYYRGMFDVNESIFDDFLCDYDEAMVEMTGNASFGATSMSIEFLCKKTGVSDIEITIRGQKAVAHVTGKTAGIEGVEADGEQTLTFDGSNILAQDCEISVFAANGLKVAEGESYVSTESLASGIYIAVAKSAAGTVSTLKVAVK